MSQSKSMNTIFTNKSFIIFTTQSDLVYFLCENIMNARTNDIHFCQFCFRLKEQVPAPRFTIVLEECFIISRGL